MSDWKNLLFYGDNLDVLRNRTDLIPDGSVDLIYLDPPWNKKKTYNAIFKEKSGEDSPAQIRAFHDTWQWDQSAVRALREIEERGDARVIQTVNSLIDFLGHNDLVAYLVMMGVRLLELKRVLKDEGSIYLHCDPTVSHYVKALMDAVFGPKRFRNEIVWGYRTGGTSKRYFAKKHDVILFYSKTNSYKFNQQRYKSWQKKQYRYSEKYKEHFDENEQRWYHWAVCRDVWDDINAIGTENKERLSYPTQKPEALLERIISASSNEGDVVMDPFCGCGTTVVAAQRQNRKWIGIDITHLAVGLMERRLRREFGPKIAQIYKVIGRPYDVPSAKALALLDRLEFQRWAVDFVDGYPLDGKDHGVDGLIFFRDAPDGKLKKVIVQVKSGEGIKPGDVRDLDGTVRAQKAVMGFLVTLKAPTEGMIQAAATYGLYESPLGKVYPKIQIRTIADLFENKRFDYPASLNVTFEEATKARKGQSDLKLLE